MGLRPKIWPKNHLSGFTLIEILMGFAILIIFFTIAHQIFVGGSKSAGKGNWLDNATTELRNTISHLGADLKNTSYPSTLKADAVKDAGSNDVSSPLRTKWYVKIPKKVGAFRGVEATAGDTTPKVIMVYYICESERPENTANPKGKVIKKQLIFESHDYGKGPFGELTLLQTEKPYTTAGPNYAENTPVDEPTDADSPKRIKLLTDITSIKFTTVQDPPIHDPSPLKISFECKYVMDPKTHKEMELLVPPNVGVSELP